MDYINLIVVEAYSVDDHILVYTKCNAYQRDHLTMRIRNITESSHTYTSLV